MNQKNILRFNFHKKQHASSLFFCVISAYDKIRVNYIFLIKKMYINSDQFHNFGK